MIQLRSELQAQPKKKKKKGSNAFRRIVTSKLMCVMDT